MPASVSYRLDQDLKRALSEQARAEGITESSLVTRLLSEGIKIGAHPGIVYRDGPSGRRAGLAAGPDVSEVITAVRHVPGSGDRTIRAAAEQLGLPEHLVRLAVDFAAAHPDEIDARIAANEAAAVRARHTADERARLLAS